ncbi:hypothetical protein [uncultured Psychroserpens sp.]|uniref:hypothetical protein n=1 Tax=uncultured Psychroserpens sp. TaxID=255436 RepID=UPI0026344952|nr:hypothetical protein [uncultured Psychroserpens sp.]
MKKSVYLFTTLFLFLSLFINAQQHQNSHSNCDTTTTGRTIKFNGSSDVEAIIINVSEDTKIAEIAVNTTIKSGHLTVEIHDPKGNKKGNFSVESLIKSSEKKSELVCGQMHKQISDPKAGKWIVHLIPKNVSGEVTIQTFMSN